MPRQRPSFLLVLTARFPSGSCPYLPGDSLPVTHPDGSPALRDGYGNPLPLPDHLRTARHATLTGIQHLHHGSPVDATAFALHLAFHATKHTPRVNAPIRPATT